MKKRNVVMITIVLFLLLILISCNETQNLTPTQINERIAQAETAMGEGDDETAQELFEEVLQYDPGNPQANMGVGLIQFLRSQKDMMDIVADYLTLDQLNQFRGLIQQPVKSAAGGMMLARVLADRADTMDLSLIQSKIADIVAQMEMAKFALTIAVMNMAEGDVMEVNPNAFDWNEDGFVDPDQPLRFTFDVEGESRVWWLLFAYEPEIYFGPGFQGRMSTLLSKLSSRSSRGFFDDSVRGDAWFDLQTFEALMDTGMIEEGYEPVFNSADKLSIDINQAKILLALVNLELTMLEPLMIWDLDPTPELTDFLDEMENADVPMNYATSTLDTNQDGIISSTEFQAILPEEFLTFYDDENGGLDAIVSWQNAIIDLCTQAVDVGQILLGDLPVEIIDALDQVIALVTDPTEKIEMAENTYLIPGHFFASPQLYDDLKDIVIPTVEYEGDYFYLYITDPTFGGLIEIIE